MNGRRISNELVGILAVGAALAGLTLALNGGLEAQIERLDGRIDRIEVQMHSTNERLARLEGRIEGLGYLDSNAPRTRGDAPSGC